MNAGQKRDLARKPGVGGRGDKAIAQEQNGGRHELGHYGRVLAGTYRRGAAVIIL